MTDAHTILVVDDHPDNRELLMRRLEREPFRPGIPGTEGVGDAQHGRAGQKRHPGPMSREPFHQERYGRNSPLV